MAREDELRMFLYRIAPGALRLETEDGCLILQSRTYHELRRDLAIALQTKAGCAPTVKVMIGRPARPAHRGRFDPLPQATPRLE
jgi:hypothetical protein